MASAEDIALRPALDPQQSCATCGNWLDGVCQVLGQPTEPIMVSDAWVPMTDGAMPQAQSQPQPDLMSQLFGGPGGR